MIEITTPEQLNAFLAQHSVLSNGKNFPCNLDSLFLKTLHGILDITHEVKIDSNTIGVKNKASQQYRSDFVSYTTKVQAAETLPFIHLKVQEQGSMVQWLQQNPICVQAGFDFTKPIHIRARLGELATIPAWVTAHWQALATKHYERQYNETMYYNDVQEGNQFMLAHAHFLLEFAAKVYEVVQE